MRIEETAVCRKCNETKRPDEMASQKSNDRMYCKKCVTARSRLNRAKRKQELEEVAKALNSVSGLKAANFAITVTFPSQL